MPAAVLVVDDDDDIRDALASILRDEGFSVREARNGLEALEQIAVDEPDLVLLDLMMPVMNGWEVMQALRRAHRDLRVIVLSAVPAPDRPDHVQKPISLDKLLRLLESFRTHSMQLRHAMPRPD